MSEGHHTSKSSRRGQGYVNIPSIINNHIAALKSRFMLKGGKFNFLRKKKKAFYERDEIPQHVPVSKTKPSKRSLWQKIKSMF